MSQWIGYTCDRCGKEYRDGGGTRVWFRLGTEEDPAEGLKTANHALDVCKMCVGGIVFELIAALPEKQQEALHDKIKRGIKG